MVPRKKDPPVQPVFTPGVGGGYKSPGDVGGLAAVISGREQMLDQCCVPWERGRSMLVGMQGQVGRGCSDLGAGGLH